MHLYMVVFEEAMSTSSEAFQKVTSISGNDPFQLTDFSLLMQTPIDNPQAIRDLLGIGEGLTGAVFKLNGSYSGFYDEKLWEWLREAREQRVYG